MFILTRRSSVAHFSSHGHIHTCRPRWVQALTSPLFPRQCLSARVTDPSVLFTYSSVLSLKTICSSDNDGWLLHSANLFAEQKLSVLPLASGGMDPTMCECLVDDSSAVYGGCLRSVWVCMCVAVGVHVYVYVYVCGCVRVWCSGEMGTDFHLLWNVQEGCLLW